MARWLHPGAAQPAALALAALVTLQPALTHAAARRSGAEPPGRSPAVALEAAWADDDAPAARSDDQGALRLEDVKSGRSLRGPAPVEPLRAEALKESALAYGARAGWYARTREINRMLDREAGRLDALFPFGPLLLAHGVIPPVLQTARDTVRKHSNTQLRFADAIYHLVTPARLAVAPPDWRTYLYAPAVKPEPPDETLQPDRAKAAEVALWEHAVERGWHHGVRQANHAFEVQLNRLERDLRGMVLYRELLAKGMVTAPRLTEQWQGITQQGPTLRINDRVLEIQRNAGFVADNQRWKPYPSRPYRPAPRDPSVNLRLLGATVDTPPPPPAATVAPRWEIPLWQQ